MKRLAYAMVVVLAMILGTIWCAIEKARGRR